MDALSVASAIIGIVDGATSVARQTYRLLTSVLFFTRHYGVVGWSLCLFENRSIWRVQVQILRSNNDMDAMNFKRAAQDECSIIAVASTIVAQIAITALSLDDLSRTPWVARGAFTFSLVSSLIAVYYATKQYCHLGRCLNAEDVRTWIRGKNIANARNRSRMALHLDLSTNAATQMSHENFLSSASVLTVSAPNILLDSSINSFLVGLGIYFGFVWTRNLDEVAGTKSSEAVFITYIVGLMVCYLVFALSSIVVADKSYVSEEDLVGETVTSRSFWAIRKRGFQNRDDESARGDEQHSTVQSTSSYEMASNSATEPGVSIDTLEGPAPGQGQQGGAAQIISIQEELVQVFREAARLRNESIIVDERLARLLEKLGRGTDG
ncbi:hypothetical protein yc1106_02538 [Curvularia clavata]|uniref:Uncharacterized protein n=1 Tax=Curvularia clavata TaxID=95742 RepID=A0A9Q9DR14_CURCL|nr:hypothetical protein yc1106_02538 [Curvularia clavata]